VDCHDDEHTIEGMLVQALENLRIIEEALTCAPAQRRIAIPAALRAIAAVEQALTENLTMDGEVLTVEDEHESYAIEVVTSYLDGAARGDGYELLGDAVSHGVNGSDGSIAWTAAVVAALARLSGDLALLAAARDGKTDWDDALEIIQALASTR
jgi:hypothetical protein